MHLDPDERRSSCHALRSNVFLILAVVCTTNGAVKGAKQQSDEQAEYQCAHKGDLKVRAALWLQRAGWWLCACGVDTEVREHADSAVREQIRVHALERRRSSIGGDPACCAVVGKPATDDADECGS